MLPLFLSKTAAEFFEKTSDLTESVKNSEYQPVLVAFLNLSESSSDLHLQHIEQIEPQLEAIVLLFTIDCPRYLHLCNDFGINEYPSYKLIVSPDPRFQIHLNPDDILLSPMDTLRGFITAAKPKNVNTSTLKAMIKNIGGKSLPVIPYATGHSSFVEQIARLSPIITEPVLIHDGMNHSLIVHVSSKCSFKYNGSLNTPGSLSFLFDHRFSHFHCYGLEELLSYQPEVPAFVVISATPLDSILHHFLTELSGIVCGEAIVGYMDVTKDSLIERTLINGCSREELPALFLLRRPNDDFFRMDGDLTIDNAVQFANTLLQQGNVRRRWRMDNSILEILTALIVIIAGIFAFPNVIADFVDWVCLHTARIE